MCLIPLEGETRHVHEVLIRQLDDLLAHSFGKVICRFDDMSQYVDSGLRDLIEQTLMD